MHAAFTVEIGGGHRPVKRNKSGFIKQPGLQNTQVAIGKQGFRVVPNQVEVETFEQIIRSVTAAVTKDCRDLRISEGRVEILETLFHSSGEVVQARVHGGVCLRSRR